MDGAILTMINSAPSDHVSVLDRGLQYGDGVFETMLYRQGRVFFHAMHMERLVAGLSALRILISLDRVERDLNTFIRQLDADSISGAIIKLIVTRGSGGRGYNPGLATTPSVILSAFSVPDRASFVQAGADVTLCKTRISEQAVLAGIKHLNRLDNVLARAEWDNEFHEGLMLCQRGNIVEGTMSNVFFVEGNVLLTPSIRRCGVAGIVRRCVIEMLAPRLGVEVIEKDIPENQVHSMVSGFLTNSVLGIVPIRSLGGRSLVSSSLTGNLQHALDVCRENT